MEGAKLDGADLRGADLKGLSWQNIHSISGANIAGVRNAPAGFSQWAMQHGAIEDPNADN